MFAGICLCLLAILAVIESFHQKPVYSGGSWQVELDDGQLTFEGNTIRASFGRGFQLWIGIKEANLGTRIREMFALPRWYSGSGWSVVIPLGLPIWIIGTACAWFFWLPLRYPPGCCWSCGYDLRGSRGGICPECGVACKTPVL